jgi:hypothetical protein
MPTGDWSQRAVRVGRAVARFKLATQPKVQAWQVRRVVEGGERCFGCDENFQADESHLEVTVARTLVMRLHEDCFEAWKKMAVGSGPDGNGGAAPDDEAED